MGEFGPVCEECGSTVCYQVDGVTKCAECGTPYISPHALCTCGQPRELHDEDKLCPDGNGQFERKV